ncbi:MAG: uroporphyrinogen-III C-methyltransferase [bacterium]|nr:uroporphyrinogen-III C-methyltransferase [bacterium]
MYPVMLEVDGRACLVVGGGGVALRKVQGLVEEGARVTVVAPDVVVPLREMSQRGAIEVKNRAYELGDAEGYALVFAATDQERVNRQVFEDATSRGIWVNVADDPKLCSFQLPGRVRRGPLQIAIGSAGRAPFAVRRLRQLLERRLGTEWGEWFEAAARYRKAVLGSGKERPSRERSYDLFFSNTVDRNKLTARVPSRTEESDWIGSEAVDHRMPSRDLAMARQDDCVTGHDRGFVSLIGAGPGCAGLLTVRGRERMLRANAVVYDRLAAAALPPDLDPRVELHCVGKNAGNHPVPQGEINSLLVRLAREGMRVARLKGGDPYVFGRGGEEAEVLQAEGVPFEVVPGVTSGIAAAAWAGIPVTHRREAVRVTLVTAHEALKSDGPQVRWDLHAQDPHATLVGYMGVTALPSVVKKLVEGGMDPSMPAAMVEQGTTSAQRSVVATLESLPQAVTDAGLRPPALFVIGPTVGHVEKLDWVRHRPLSGLRLLVPAAASQLIAAAEEAGADVLPVPMPVTPAARIVMAALPAHGCLVRDRADVDWLDEERDTVQWYDKVMMWCLTSEAAVRARGNGWEAVELPAEASCEEVVAWIASSLEDEASGGAEQR